SSLAARTGKLQFDDIHWSKNYRAMPVYSQSKLANQLFTYGLQRRLTDAKVSNVISVVAHPGGTNTNIADKWQAPGLLKKTLIPLLMPLGQSPDQGALPQLYASVDPTAKPGGYYGPNRLNEVMGYPKEAKIPAQARSTADQDRLWDISEELTGVKYLS
ncbi:MAG: short chain dehydrogenase, partial [Bacteroidota bacterium]